MSRLFVEIRGGGIAGRVLAKELEKRGIASRIEDRSAFPRDKVCGGVLQADSWHYLRETFSLGQEARPIEGVDHYWRKRLVSRTPGKGMVFVSRFNLDHHLVALSQEPPPGATTVAVEASGAEDASGEWIGFQAQAQPTVRMSMHYCRNLYLGVSPAGPEGHAAFIARRGTFQGPEDLRARVASETGVRLEGPLKGCGRIRYGYSARSLAVGDAKLTTFPFLGFGMKHAILSARLLARLLAEGRQADYDAEHRRAFAAVDRLSRAVGRIHGSAVGFVLRPVLASRKAIDGIYRAVHD